MHLLAHVLPAVPQQVVWLPVCGAESSRFVLGSESVLVCERRSSADCCSNSKVHGYYYYSQP